MGKTHPKDGYRTTVYLPLEHQNFGGGVHNVMSGWKRKIHYDEDVVEVLDLTKEECDSACATHVLEYGFTRTLESKEYVSKTGNGSGSQLGAVNYGNIV